MSGTAAVGAPGEPGGVTEAAVEEELTRDTTVLVGGRLVIAAMGWAGTLLVARTLDAEAFGRFAFVFGLLGMLDIVTDLGVGRVALAGVLPGADRRERFAGTYVALRAALGWLGVAVAMAYVLGTGQDRSVVAATAVAAPLVVLATSTHGYEVVFQATGRLRVVALSHVLGQLAQLLLTVAVVVLGGGLVWLVVPAVLNAVVALIVTVTISRRLLRVELNVDVAVWRHLLREAVPLSLGHALASLIARVDTLLLEALDTFTAVGLYGVAYKFVDLLVFVPKALTTVALAGLVQAWPDDLARFTASIRRTTVLMGLLAGGMVVAMAPITTDLLARLYGERFGAGGRALLVLVAATACSFLVELFVVGLVATGRHRVWPLAAAAGLALNIGLNLVLIPRYSIDGAAWATLVASAVVLLGLLLAARGIPGFDLAAVRSLVPIVVAAVLGTGATALATHVVPWFVAPAAGLAVFIVAVVLTSTELQALLPARLRRSRPGGHGTA